MIEVPTYMIFFMTMMVGEWGTMIRAPHHPLIRMYLHAVIVMTFQVLKHHWTKSTSYWNSIQIQMQALTTGQYQHPNIIDKYERHISEIQEGSHENDSKISGPNKHPSLHWSSPPSSTMTSPPFNQSDIIRQSQEHEPDQMFMLRKLSQEFFGILTQLLWLHKLPRWPCSPRSHGKKHGTIFHQIIWRGEGSNRCSQPWF